MTSPIKYPSDVADTRMLQLLGQGKSRDTFRALGRSEDGCPLRLIVATRRISTHNIVHESLINSKDQVLNAITVHWMTGLLDQARVPHHLVAWGRKIYDYLPGRPGDYPSDLHLRAIVVKDLGMAPIEVIYRGYMVGSLYDKFYKKGLPNPYGLDFPSGLPLMFPFMEPILTPTDKSETDEPLLTASTYAAYKEACDLGLRVFRLTRDNVREVGIELVDSKFEFGRTPDGVWTLADEVVTPDSSRYTKKSEIIVGAEPKWLDKQLARDEAERLWGNGPKCPLKFSEGVKKGLTDTYLQVSGEIFRQSLREFQANVLG